MLDGSAWFWFAAAGTVVVAFAVVRSRWPVAPPVADLDRELAHLVDRAAVEALRDQLLGGPVLVRAWCEVNLVRGPVLLIDHGAQRVRMRLYGGSSLPEDGADRPTRRPPRGPVPLVRIDDLGERGWLVVLDPPDGRIRFHGWLIEQVRPLAVESRP